MRSVIKHVYQNLLAFFFPPYCLCCGVTVPYDLFYCSVCKQLMKESLLHNGEPVSGNHISQKYSLFPFDLPEIQESIHLLKYRSIPKPAQELFYFGLSHCTIPTYDLIIPIPLHRRRERKRGYNQAAILAKSASNKLCGELCETLLIRKKYTRTQTKKDRSQRLTSMKDVFALSNGGESLKGKRVLLIDDVCTTGATAESCAQVLIECGAAQIDLLTLARA